MSRAPFAALLAGAFAASLGASGTLHACSCTNQNTIPQETAAATTVFFGRVTGIRPAGDGINVLVTMTPLLRWKGGLAASVTVMTGANDGLCGFHFDIGLDYVVFGWQQAAPSVVLFTHSCTYDMRADAALAVQTLGPPLSPTPVRARSWGGVKRAWR